MWGGEIEIRVLSLIFNITIKIYHDGGDKWVFQNQYGTSRETIHVLKTDEGGGHFVRLINILGNTHNKNEESPSLNSHVDCDLPRANSQPYSGLGLGIDTTILETEEHIKDQERVPQPYNGLGVGKEIFDETPKNTQFCDDQSLGKEQDKPIDHNTSKSSTFEDRTPQPYNSQGLGTETIYEEPKNPNPKDFEERNPQPYNGVGLGKETFPKPKDKKQVDQNSSSDSNKTTVEFTFKTPRSTKKKKEIIEEQKWFVSMPDDPPKNWWTVLRMKGTEEKDEVKANMKKIVLALHPDKLDPEIREKGKKYFQSWNTLMKGLEKPNWRNRISGLCLCDDNCNCMGCVNKMKCSCGQTSPRVFSFYNPYF